MRGGRDPGTGACACHHVPRNGAQGRRSAFEASIFQGWDCVVDHSSQESGSCRPSVVLERSAGCACRSESLGSASSNVWSIVLGRTGYRAQRRISWDRPERRDPSKPSSPLCRRRSLARFVPKTPGKNACTFFSVFPTCRRIHHIPFFDNKGTQKFSETVHIPAVTTPSRAPLAVFVRLWARFFFR